jgi:hypothetical protein
LELICLKIVLYSRKEGHLFFHAKGAERLFSAPVSLSFQKPLFRDARFSLINPVILAIHNKRDIPRRPAGILRPITLASF